MVDVNKYLKNFYRGTKNPSLKAMRYFMNIYDNFEGQMNFIHIAGTNGKGSCTEIISNILINQGYKVGKFLSPHLIRYNERISINGEEMSIITSIGYDHMNILGNTLPEISYQKAGIIKENSNTVIFEQQSEVNNVFVTTCKSKNNNLHIVKKSDISNYSFDNEFQYFDYKKLKI